MRKHLFGLGKKKKNPHRTLLSDNHIARLGTCVLYTKPVQGSFEIQEKIIFSTPGMKGQVSPAMEMRGTQRMGRTGMESKGRALESQAKETRDTLNPPWLSKALAGAKQPEGLFCNPFFLQS